LIALSERSQSLPRDNWTTFNLIGDSYGVSIQIEMSSKTKGKAPAATASYSQEETITVSESQPPPTYPTRSKGKSVVRDSQAEGSSAAQTIPSSSRAVDEGTPAYSAVEDANDQLRNEGSQKLPEELEELEAARQEITALRATNQQLLQRSVTPDSGDYRRKGRGQSALGKSRNHGRKHQNHQKPFGPSGSPSYSDDSSSSSDRSEGSDHGFRRHRSRHRKPRRSHKIDDPDKLDNGVDPTFGQWKDLLEGKMYGNRDWWKTERERMFYVFSRTQGDARDHLHARWGTDSYDPFLNVADMLKFLKQIYTNPNEVREAKDAYATLQQGLTPFPEFRVQFLKLAMKGHIPRSEFKDDLYRKLNPRVREILSGSARRLTYEELCECALDVDIEVRHNQKLALAKKAARAPPTSQAQKPRTSTPGILPIRQSLLPVPDRLRLSAPPAPPDQRQRSHSAEKEDTCHNCGKPGHWAKECPEAPRHQVHEINELHPRVMEVDTDDEEAGEASQPENGDA
jgi:hypothetical protein